MFVSLLLKNSQTDSGEISYIRPHAGLVRVGNWQETVVATLSA